MGNLAKQFAVPFFEDFLEELALIGCEVQVHHSPPVPATMTGTP